jgi:hypothetical protein
MSYFEKENTAVPRIEENEIPKGQTYRAKFISAGAVGYKDGVYFLSQDSLDSFAWTLKGCPVVIGHQDIEDTKDMKEKAVGYVSNVDRCETGDWYADFIIFEDKAINKIANGDVPYVSCAYRADLTTDDCDINNVKYKKRIIGGEMLHLALVKNPRYNGTDIWRNSTDEFFVGEGALYNEKENVMFGFKKTKVELDKDTLINTSLGDKTIEELINELEAAQTKIAEQEAKIKDLEAEKEAAKASEATVVEDPKVEETAVETETKENAVEVEESTDAGLKQDLNNALTEKPKVEVVTVPNVNV